MAASTAFIAASTNRFSHAASALDSLVALGSNNLVALWDVASNISDCLPGHSAAVTCVRFMSNERLMTGDEQGMLFLWRMDRTKWRLASKVRAHGKALTSLSTLGDIVVSGSSDSVVKVWEVTISDELNEKQTISTGKRYPLSLALAYLPGTQVILLAVSGTHTNVRLLLRNEDQFITSAHLAGHEDWVRALSFRSPTMHEEPLILASGSQDATIRLWNIEPVKIAAPVTESELNDELLDSFEMSLGEVVEGEVGRQISLKHHILTASLPDGSSRRFSVTFDALLVGHEFGVTSLSWRPDLGPGSIPTILSSSTDSSLILWSPSTILGAAQDRSTSIWINRQRFGDVGGQRLGGFVGSLWARGGQEALAWGWAGGWRRWACKNMGETAAEEDWQELGAISGHRGPVKGLAWSPNGEYLISAGVDQTTRIFGELYHSDESQREWHEIARPQVHGYDLTDAVFLESLKFVSIADEKVVRVFEAPRNFVQLVKTLNVAYFTENEVDRPVGASVPPLGLSNKAVGDGSSVTPVLAAVTRRPFEGELAGATLWPEIEKIYGHGYESISLAVSSSHRFIATACKATSPDHAVIRIYETGTFKPFGRPLTGHTLTVTRIAFSPDDKYVLSVSRDRTWRLFELKDDQGYVPVGAQKCHARIIWDCAWSVEGDIFSTASRDRLVKIWQQCDGEWITRAMIKTPSSATAIDFSPVDSKERRKMAVGFENGIIHILSNALSDVTLWRLDTVIDKDIAHDSQIHRLSWRPAINKENENNIREQLASCSEDGTLKVLIIHNENGPMNH